MKNSLVIYYDILEQLEDFTDEQFGHLLRAVIKFDMTGQEPKFTGEMKVAFKCMKPILIKNKENYNEICEKRRIAGSKGGKQKVANATKCYQNEQMQTSVADNDNEYDNDNVNENDIYMQASKQEEKNNNYLNVYTNTHTHARERKYDFEDYDDIFENMYVSHELKFKLIEFIKHCQVNGKIVTNDKLKDIIIRLDMAYTNDIDKIQSLKRAINSGCFDIQEGRG